MVGVATGSARAAKCRSPQRSLVFFGARFRSNPRGWDFPCQHQIDRIALRREHRRDGPSQMGLEDLALMRQLRQRRALSQRRCMCREAGEQMARIKVSVICALHAQNTSDLQQRRALSHWRREVVRESPGDKVTVSPPGDLV